MEFVSSYFITNFILLCIEGVLLINCIIKYNEHKRLSNYLFIIIGITIALTILDAIKAYAQDVKNNIPIPTICASISYMLLPTCIFVFILLCGQKMRKKKSFLLLIPLGINFIVYLLPFFPLTRELVFYFGANHSNTISFYGGHPALRYTSHIISAFYICWLVYICIMSLQAKHISHALNIFLCVAVVIIAVLIDTLGEANVVNTSIAVSTIFYYLYIFAERSKYDALTNLFNRAMYYSDLPRLDKMISSVIQIDMNGLKYINDTFGHQKGDECIIDVANILLKVSTRKMFAYRLGGDEFTVLVINTDEQKVISTIQIIKDELAKAKCYCAIGYSYRDDKETQVSDLLKLAEKNMYLDKDEFYKNSCLERRKATQEAQN